MIRKKVGCVKSSKNYKLIQVVEIKENPTYGHSEEIDKYWVIQEYRQNPEVHNFYTWVEIKKFTNFNVAKLEFEELANKEKF